MTTAHLFGGRLEWGGLRQAFDGWIGMWQDREGLHVEPLPPEVPRWAWLWGWSPTRDALLRARIDGTSCHTAILALRADGGGGPLGHSRLVSRGSVVPTVTLLVARSREDGPVRQYIGPDADDGGLGADYLMVQLPDLGEGGLTFYVPSVGADPDWTR